MTYSRQGQSLKPAKPFNTMHHVLESGLYEIRSHGTGNLVGRSLNEDFSNNPKPVYSLPHHVQPVGKVRIDSERLHALHI